jgi:glycosyltransferase involved in cell wall biosynthesis
LKIAVNTRFLIKNNLEGMGRFTYETLYHMVKNHPEDEFYFLFDRPYDPSFVFADNVKPIVLYPPARHPFLFYIWFEISVKLFLNKIKPDVFLSTDNFTCISTDTPSVVVVHDIAFKHFKNQDKKINIWYYNRYTPQFLKRANHIITVSEFTKQDLLTHFSFLNKNKISVCYNGCRTDFKSLTNEEKTQFKARFTEGVDYFVYVGSVHPRKNVARLIQAFDIFKKNNGSDFKLVIGGRIAWKTGDVKTTFDAAIFKKDIIFTGYIAENDLPKWIGAAFSLVYVSLLEGFGIPILEAMNCDVPVITSNCTSMPEVAGEAAILVNPESVDEIAMAMHTIINNKNLKEKLIEKGRFQRQKFSWKRTADTIYSTLEHIAKKTAPSQRI